MSNPNLNSKEDINYYNRSRNWPLLFNIKDGSSVLDIGCGRGFLGKLLKDVHRCNVTGVEIVEENFNHAIGVLDNAFLGDVETMPFPDDDFMFDYVIFSDSLEHLVNPDLVLERVLKHLNFDGKLLIAMPNVRNFRVTLPLLLRDSWEYQEEGLLDKTHLRFFTRSSLCNLLQTKGFDVTTVLYDLPLNSKVGILNLLTFGVFKKHLTSHYFVESCIKKY